MATPLWDLDQALRLVRAIQSVVKKDGYHVSLGGGVLNKGESDKDLDLYFHPLENAEPVSLDNLLAFLTQMWGESVNIGYGSSIYQRKIKFGWGLNHKRIDCFIL